ncbi:ABC transporter ATP-binding protein [Hyphomicrobium sp.]|uniref:ABC transporter ATP-binding protein n=1 Tax=Hyphomicrobium sp. TaxID=82 RepID=UPI002E355F3C|nr:ABC transporter ATP-binding protein [Hyphomicrobium sp.]HEX2841356.1 ABC transporter ATP-binding protein [Hyphomicrobium sp.]
MDIGPNRIGENRDGQSGTSSGTFLSARDIHFRVGNRDILKGIDLVIGPGEIMSLLGANGAGKTTLLRVLLGLAAPARGEVFIDNAPTASLPRREVARSLAYVPQVHMTPFPYSVREVVAMGRLPQKGLLSNPSDRDHDVVQRVLGQIDISHLADRVYSEISGGERQLTLIARALAQQASILILDEPMANLDFGYQALLSKHLRGLADDGHTILMSGHDPQLAYSASTRIGLLIDGHLEQDGKPDDVLTAATMQKLYGVDVESVALACGRRAFFPTGQ